MLYKKREELPRARSAVPDEALLKCNNSHDI